MAGKSVAPLSKEASEQRIQQIQRRLRASKDNKKKMVKIK